MPTTYDKADADVIDVANKMIDAYHPHLREVEVTITYLFANAGLDKEGNPKHAIKRQGVPCSAQVRKTTLKQRAAGATDAEIVVDEHVWKRLTDEERDALIDHELEHLELKKTAEGDIDADDLGRPKLKLKIHDFEVWGFTSIVKRHGEAAIETQAALNFINGPDGQMVMEFSSRG